MESEESAREYVRLNSELRSLTRSVYIVNQKHDTHYRRQWKIYAVLNDGSSIFDATKVTEWTEDDAESLHRGMQKVITLARRYQGTGQGALL